MNKEVHIKTYDEWLKYYENATKEQVIEDLTHDVQYFADAVKDIKDLQQELDKYKNIIKLLKHFGENSLGIIYALKDNVEPTENEWLNLIEYEKYLRELKGDDK